MAFKTSKWIKRLAVILALCMICCFTGCTGDDSSDSSSDSSQTDTEPENLRKVGYIFSGNASDEFSFAGQINQQRILASNRCSMDSCYIENVSIEDFEAAVKKLAEDGCTDIVAAGANFANVVRAISGKYMNLNFIGYGNTSSTANTSAYTEHAFQGAYVAGMVATYNCNENIEKRRIGVVVDSDLLYNRAVINAVTLGTKLVVTNAEVYGAAGHTDAEIDQAVDWLIENQCEVIVCYTGSSRSADRCQNRGVKFIGNLDFSGKEDDYSKMLMYYYCKRDSYYLSQFKKMQLDQWGPETYIGTMGNGTVMVSKALSACANVAGSQKIMDTLVPYVTNGSAYIFSGELLDNTGVVRVFQTDEMTYSEIYSMDWYVQGVEAVKNFRQPSGDVENPLEIKY